MSIESRCAQSPRSSCFESRFIGEERNVVSNKTVGGYLAPPYTNYD